MGHPILQEELIQSELCENIVNAHSGEFLNKTIQKLTLRTLKIVLENLSQIVKDTTDVIFF